MGGWKDLKLALVGAQLICDRKGAGEQRIVMSSSLTHQCFMGISGLAILENFFDS